MAKKCESCNYDGKARAEYVEMLRPLQKRISNQRTELRRLQVFEQWYNKYVLRLVPEHKDVPRCKHNVVIDPTGSYVCMKCFNEPTANTRAGT